MKDKFFKHFTTILNNSPPERGGIFADGVSPPTCRPKPWRRRKPKGQRMGVGYPTICIAVSGGADSICLTHLISEYAKKNNVKLIAVTVDHQLRPEAKDEAEFVHKFCTDLGIYHETLVWKHGEIKSDIENKARIARYDLIKEFARKNKASIILTAHHQDDQIETFLMNLSRGSGIYGLSGMKEMSILNSPLGRGRTKSYLCDEDGVGLILVRPLLQFSKQEILDYCKENKLSFINDSMNEDETFTRVKIRKNRHLMSEKLGITDDKIILAINNLSRIRQHLECAVALHLEECEVQQNVYDLEKFMRADDEIILRSLSLILMEVSGSPFGPTLEKLENLKSSIEKGELPKTLGGVKIFSKSTHLIFQKLK
ncbi:MAG: tRNA lysidine(34) synthetase TilS [Rickettsiales bacterium]|jgi:tRNA(Ile)-lysidine synthase|nr:tRNA lysidine(34) synthetase TilS [Rickettsiales bacterium]